MDNQLAYMDQGSFLGLRSLGRQPLIQFVWIYDRDVDVDGLLRFQSNLGHGLLGRRIETSPLLFGRHRWVSQVGPEELDIAATARPRDEVWDWADARLRLPIDPERGPAWHLGVQPLTPVGAAVALVVSHSVADGGAVSLAIADAVQGIRRDLGYPPPGARIRRRAVVQDLAATARSLPDMARGVAAAVRTARTEIVSKGRRGPSLQMPPRGPRRGNDDLVALPTATAWLDLELWDRRAESLGGSSNSLFLGFVARLALGMGRVDGAGRVVVALPVSDRRVGDSRANALSVAKISIDPAAVTATLTGVRSDVAAGLAAVPYLSKDLLASMALTPFTPRALLRRVEKVAADRSDDVGCSNLGDCDARINRPDGTDADWMTARSIESPVTAAILDRMGGHLFAGSGRVHGRVFISVGSWIPGGANGKYQLRERVGRALNDMGLTGIVE